VSLQIGIRNKQTEGKGEQSTSWNSFNNDLRNVDAKMQTRDTDKRRRLKKNQVGGKRMGFGCMTRRKEVGTFDEPVCK